MVENNISFETGNTEVLSGLELDIYLPQFNLAFEYNGAYFHSDLFRKKNYHLDKTLQANRKGVHLFHVWEYDWIHRQEILKSMILSQIGKSESHIYARQTNIQEVNSTDAARFLQDNHLQGAASGKVRLGLYKGEELISLMVFSSLRNATGQESKQGSWELLRFYNKLNTSVVGGASKLFKHFLQVYSPEYILSYANRDWSRGNLYTQLGMTETQATPPGYCYVKSNYKFSRVQFQKHKLVEEGEDPSLSEYEIMTKRGYLRVWDCGNLKYEWKREN